MVDSITSLGRNGLSGWVMQRVSAVILGLYALFLVSFFVTHPQLSFETWHALFANTWVKVITLLVLFNLAAHAWIGLWTVITDYIQCSCARLVLELGLILGLLAYVVWGVLVLWS